MCVKGYENNKTGIKELNKYPWTTNSIELLMTQKLMFDKYLKISYKPFFSNEKIPYLFLQNLKRKHKNMVLVIC